MPVKFNFNPLSPWVSAEDASEQDWYGEERRWVLCRHPFDDTEPVFLITAYDFASVEDPVITAPIDAQIRPEFTLGLCELFLENDMAPIHWPELLSKLWVHSSMPSDWEIKNAYWGGGKWPKGGVVKGHKGATFGWDFGKAEKTALVKIMADAAPPALWVDEAHKVKALDNYAVQSEKSALAMSKLNLETKKAGGAMDDPSHFEYLKDLQQKAFDALNVPPTLLGSSVSQLPKQKLEGKEFAGVPMLEDPNLDPEKFVVVEPQPFLAVCQSCKGDKPAHQTCPKCGK